MYGTKTDKPDERWGLLFVSWAEWLGMDLAPKTISTYTPSQIAALCLFGMLAHEFTMKEWLTDLNRWLRWGSVSKEYFGENAHWFTDHFTDKDAPSCYDEIDRYTLKSALKEIAHQILYVAKKM